MQAAIGLNNSVRKSTIRGFFSSKREYSLKARILVPKHACQMSGGKSQTQEDSSALTSTPTTYRAAPMTVRSMALLVLISVVFFALVRVSVGEAPSSDLRALWLAGSYFPEIASVYAGSDSAFTMEPPEVWITATQDAGIETAVYPFIYPPLWAWVMSELVDVTTMTEFGRAMSIINPCLVVLCALLAMRIAAPTMPRPAFFAISLSIVATSIVFLLAFAENQPQILVAFLTLLGIERTRSGAPISGGLAMALAASLKLYPVVFALIWLTSGKIRATLAFAIIGAALGVMSIFVAGWPMHEAYLSEISAISNTVLMSRANYSLDPLIGILTLSETQMISVDTLGTGGSTSWSVAIKSDAWRIFSAVVQISTLGALLLLARKSKMCDPLLWPFMFIAVAWVSPLSWIYHYMAAFLFLPALIDRIGGNMAIIWIILILSPTSYITVQIGLMADSATFALINNAALLIMGLLFLWLALRDKGTNQY